MNNLEKANIFELSENEMTSIYGGDKGWAYRLGYAAGRIAREMWEGVKTAHRARADGQIRAH